MAAFTELQILENQVAARNALNAQANQLRAELQEYFATKVGKKIVKFTPYKTFTAALQKDVTDIVSRYEHATDRKYMIWFDFGIRRIWATIKTTYATSDVSCGYADQQVFVAEIDDSGVMSTSCFENEGGMATTVFRTNYTVEQVLGTRQRIKELESEVAVLRSQIYEFKR